MKKKKIGIALGLALYSAMGLADSQLNHGLSKYGTSDWRKVTPSYVPILEPNSSEFACDFNTSTYICGVISPIPYDLQVPEVVSGKVTFTLTRDSAQSCTYRVTATYNPAQHKYYYETVFLNATPGIKCDTEYGQSNILQVNT